MSDGANALNMVYPNSVSTPTKSKHALGGGLTDINNTSTPTPGKLLIIESSLIFTVLANYPSHYYLYCRQMQNMYI